MKFIIIVYLVLLIAALYYLGNQLTPQDYSTQLLLALPAVLLYLAACLRDPGFAVRQELELCSTKISEKSSEELESSQSNTKRYCKECHQVQLTRMKHCHDCHHCVATFDHHCIWLMNCVGEKNRPLFYLCLFTNLIHATHAFASMVSRMWQHGQKQTHQLVFLSFLGILVLGLALLLAMHTLLMLANLTTWQVGRWEKISYLAGRRWREGSPFSRGAFGNIIDYWWLACQKTFKIWALCNQNKEDTSIHIEQHNLA